MKKAASTQSNEKDLVHKFWNRKSCGEELYLKDTSEDSFSNQLLKRYQLEPYISEFAEFEKTTGKNVLEIGVGLGADHQMFAQSGAKLTGIDLTERAIENTKKRLSVFDLKSRLQIGDAENLSFSNNEFDYVYSWGVIHHSPNTPKAVNEIFRVLKPGGTAKVMIYNKHSFVGYMLWVRYALLKCKFFTPLSEIYSNYLESPGTKAYTEKEALKLFEKFNVIKIKTVLTHGDLLTSEAGQRHQGLALSLARKIWPRRLIKTLFPSHGLFMLIEAKK